MNTKIKELIILMKDVVSSKDLDWKQVDGTFMFDNQRYDWKISKVK